MDTKLKVLLLHGYRQNAQTFREKTGGFRRRLKSICTFEYLEAPNSVPPEAAESEDEKMWFKFDASKETISEQVTKSKNHIAQWLEVNGPIDGIIGFSQGGCMLGALVFLAMKKDARFFKKFNFALIIAGWGPREIFGDELYRTDDCHSVIIPTCHVMGENDKIIEPERSIAFANELNEYCMRNGESEETTLIVQHPGAHCMPHDATSANLIKEWIRSRGHERRCVNDVI